MNLVIAFILHLALIMNDTLLYPKIFLKDSEKKKFNSRACCKHIKEDK